MSLNINTNIKKFIFILAKKNNSPYFKIYKDFNKQINKIELLPPPNIKIYDQINISRFDNNEYRDATIYFINTLESNFSKENLKYFYYNINSVSIGGNTYLKEIVNNLGSVYDASLNSIEINKLKPTHIFHELFHMSSSYLLNGMFFSGFHRHAGDSLDIGRGLNEGYTELMTQRYFKNYNGFGNYLNHTGYIYFVKIVTLLELIIGKDKMENMYLNAELHKLVKELSKYASIDDILKFINNVDFIYSYSKENKFFPYKYEMILDSLKDINLFLYDIYINYLKTIKDKNIRLKIYDFYKKLGITERFNGKEYKIMNEIEAILYIEKGITTKNNIK